MAGRPPGGALSLFFLSAGAFLLLLEGPAFLPVLLAILSHNGTGIDRRGPGWSGRDQSLIVHPDGRGSMGFFNPRTHSLHSNNDTTFM